MYLSPLSSNDERIWLILPISSSVNLTLAASQLPRTLEGLDEPGIGMV
jgi:hypothetical protein